MNIRVILAVSRLDRLPKANNIEKILKERKPVKIDLKDAKEAAVVLLLKEGDDEGSILFIKRPENEHDPWSGHMAFPGGRREGKDDDLRDTAIRETLEETGIDIRRGKILGTLDDVRPIRLPLRDIIITPFVALAPLDATIRRQSEEVAEAIWIPVTELRKKNATTYYYKNYTIWGITGTILHQFLSLIHH
jgi:8-oxo-dGTP pyrophosphatase MutT (NUDIX family)